MFDAVQTQQEMPAVRGLPAFGGRQLGQAEAMGTESGCASNDRNDVRQNFRSPKNGLILRRPRRVSHKSKGPISFGTN